MPSFDQRQLPSPRQLLKGKIEVARILKISSEEFARIIDDVERSPLFRKLFEGQGELKVFRRKPFTRARLASDFYEAPDAAADPGGDVEKHLDERRELVELIRRMGRENFERYFLHSDGGLSAREIASGCGITEGEVGQISQLLNRVFLESEMSPQVSAPSAPQIHYTNLAQILREGAEGLSIAFFSPRLAQGLYQIDHQKVAEIRKKDLLSQEERKSLNGLLSRLSLINLRKNTIYQVLLKLAEFQKNFFMDEQEEKLVPLAQNKMASELGLSASSISRLIYGRSLQTPSGREMPLESFFRSRKDWLKERLKAILGENQPLTDAELQLIIKQRYGIPLSRRSVNQYRLEISRRGRRRA